MFTEKIECLSVRLFCLILFTLRHTIQTVPGMFNVVVDIYYLCFSISSKYILIQTYNMRKFFTDVQIWPDGGLMGCNVDTPSEQFGAKGTSPFASPLSILWFVLNLNRSPSGSPSQVPTDITCPLFATDICLFVL